MNREEILKRISAAHQDCQEALDGPLVGAARAISQAELLLQEVIDGLATVGIVEAKYGRCVNSVREDPAGPIACDRPITEEAAKSGVPLCSRCQAQAEKLMNRPRNPRCLAAYHGVLCLLDENHDGVHVFDRNPTTEELSAKVQKEVDHAITDSNATIDGLNREAGG